MTKYGGSEWVRRANKRQAVRDEEREKFASKAGVTATQSMDEVSFSPADQRMKMIKLLKITKGAGVGPEHFEGLYMMAWSMFSVGLGRGGPMAEVGRNVISPHATENKQLLDFFSLDYDMRGRF